MIRSEGLFGGFVCFVGVELGVLWGGIERS